MIAIWFAALFLGAWFAISGAAGASRKFVNLGIIAGCMCLGYSLGFAAGLGTTNLWRMPHVAVPVALIFGIVAAGCLIYENR
jgi:hypothetical protein